MSLTLVFALLFGVFVASNDACSCLERHPQEVFCSAHFAIRAKVLSQEENFSNFTRIFNLRILKIFKGAWKLNQTGSVQVYGSRQRSLLVKAYTTTLQTLCGVRLANDKVYLLTGRIWKGNLQLNLCNWNQEWSEISHRQRIGVKRFYGESCKCQISPCYTHKCQELKGCGRSSGIHINSCEWRHSYCLVNADGKACSWRETVEYKNCTSDQAMP